MTATEAHVSEADAFTLQLERDPLLRSTIVAVAVLDRVPDWDRLVDRIERATRLAPTFRCKLVASPLRLAPPRWVLDADFDMAWHLRRGRIPAKGRFPAVLEFARTTGMTAFDHDRPLWEFTLLEGLPKGRAALVMKVHHALTDGIGGVQLAAHVVDLDREGTDMGPLPEAPRPTAHGPFEALLDALAYDVRHAADAGRGLARAVPGAVAASLRHPAETASDLATTVASVARFVRPVTDTMSPVMTSRRLQWHYEVLDVPTASLKKAAATVGGTLNDAFVGGLTGGLRRYHEQHGAHVEELRVTMPVSIRTGHDGVGGNKVTLLRFAVPVGIADPGDRMRAIDELCRSLRREAAIPYSNVIAGALNLLPIGFTGGMLKHVDLLASNVPGFDLDVFVAGARLESFHPFGPTLGSAANITLMSYAGTCHIGVNTDVGAVPDPEALLRCLREGFAEVTALA